MAVFSHAHRFLLYNKMVLNTKRLGADKMKFTIQQTQKANSICTAIEKVVSNRLKNGASGENIEKWLMRLKTTTWKNNKFICQFIDTQIKQLS